MDHDAWYELSEPERVASPSVLVYRERLVENIDAAIRTAGNADHLRPHVKTHKSRDVVALHIDRGVHRFKCATVAEALMLADAGCTDVLLAYQPVGPALAALFAAARRHPRTRFSCLFDNVSTYRAAEDGAERNGVKLGAFVDLDLGMHRTGVTPGEEAARLYAEIARGRWIEARGLHAYDGHINDPDYRVREAGADQTHRRSLDLASRLADDGLRVGEIVVGGTPAFPCHAAWLAERGTANASSSGDALDGTLITLSPGTYTYYDWGSATRYPDNPFKAAALVLGRVISVPRPGRFTIDVGSKAIAADPPQPRGTIVNLPEAVAGPQSEEHWVFEVASEKTPFVGAPMYVWPAHICPTIEHYDAVSIVEPGGTVSGQWPVTARSRLAPV